jgi:hypothetical protein
MEANGSSERLITIYHIEWRYIADYNNLYDMRRLSTGILKLREALE